MIITPERLASSNTEAAHQTALFCWAALAKKDRPELEWLFHVPNGGARSKATAGQLKAQGVKSGVPDLFLPIPRSVYHGCFIEQKVYPNTPSDNQWKWLKFLEDQGYYVQVSYDWEKSKEILLTYLDLP